MAKSPTHKFGQIIGDVLESAMEVPLREFVKNYDYLYLDKKGPRPARPGKKVLWTDKNGNAHDLDFVIERGGSEYLIGAPAAFIEIAWRRYTKHSRNKAQEIQGAIMPLTDTYAENCPFIGAILGGVFTEGSLTQLKSLGFHILYFDYNAIIDAFSVVGIEAFFDEDTPDIAAQVKVDMFENLDMNQVNEIEEHLRTIKRVEINEFMDILREAVLRKIDSIIVVALHGRECELGSIDDAIGYIRAYEIDHDVSSLFEFRIFVRYSNGDKVEATFKDKENAVAFLENYR